MLKSLTQTISAALVIVVVSIILLLAALAFTAGTITITNARDRIARYW